MNVDEETKDEQEKEKIYTENDVEIREIIDYGISANAIKENNVILPKPKKFIVHPVNPEKDTLFQLSYLYKVPKKEI